MKRFLIVHYSEIGLKRGNKDYFVGKLRARLKVKLEQRFKRTFEIKHSLSRLLVELPEDFVEAEYREVVGRIFAVKNFKFAFLGSADLEELSGQIWDNLPEFVFDEKKGPVSFCVRVKRSMTMEKSSTEMEREIGANLLKGEINIPVRMKPEFVVDVEFLNEHGYFSFGTYEGAGGLSSNSGGKLVCLISSGFDSPVAAYRMMRRGARVIFVHFHTFPFTDREAIENVQEIVKVLSDYQFDTKLYLVPFGEVQKKIATNLDVPAKHRVLLYRRLMIRIAERIARKDRAKGLITGDSFGQVASQTPGNLFAIHDVSTIPLFQPLIACDKEEIIRDAERIGTAVASARACSDTCSMFAARSPELKGCAKELREYEEILGVDGMVEECFEGIEVEEF